jgi:hypothetical protein
VPEILHRSVKSVFVFVFVVHEHKSTKGSKKNNGMHISFFPSAATRFVHKFIRFLSYRPTNIVFVSCRVKLFTVTHLTCMSSQQS